MTILGAFRDLSQPLMDMSLTLRPLKASKSAGNWRGQGQPLRGMNQPLWCEIASLRHETASERLYTATVGPEAAT